MPYWRLFYHLVWTTKRRAPRLTAEAEPIVYSLLRGKAIGLGGTVFALGGVEDHVHMVVSIPPKLAVATFVGQVKGVASARFNRECSEQPPLIWQEEYGAFTFDGKRLPNVVDYVERQKEHHAQGRLIPVLERLGGQDGAGAPGGLLREMGVVYRLDDDIWWAAMEALS